MLDCDMPLSLKASAVSKTPIMIAYTPITTVKTRPEIRGLIKITAPKRIEITPIKSMNISFETCFLRKKAPKTSKIPERTAQRPTIMIKRVAACSV